MIQQLDTLSPHLQAMANSITQGERVRVQARSAARSMRTAADLAHRLAFELRRVQLECDLWSHVQSSLPEDVQSLLASLRG